MRKRYYEAHLKNMKSLKSSLRSTRIKKELPRQQLPNMHVIAEVKPKCTYLPQFLKRRVFEQRVEYQRMQKKIRYSISTINRHDMIHHSRITDQIKSRLCRFKTDQSSSRVLLKCEASLNSLEKQERYKGDSSPLSQKGSKFEFSNLITEPFDYTQDKKMQSYLNKIDGLEKILLKRNL